MKHRLTIAMTLAAMTLAGVATGCSKKGPEGPTPEEIARQDSIDAARRAQARADSLEAARRAAEDAAAAERARTERATAAARDILQQMIHFDYDKSAIRSDAQQTLMQKLAVMRANPEVRLRIAGHADERGSIEYNLALGQRRAEAAKDFLVGYGIDANRLETVSFGEDRPLVNESNEQAWAQNRRDEFTIVAGGDQLQNPGM